MFHRTLCNRPTTNPPPQPHDDGGAQERDARRGEGNAELVAQGTCEGQHSGGGTVEGDRHAAAPRTFHLVTFANHYCWTGSTCTLRLDFVKNQICKFDFLKNQEFLKKLGTFVLYTEFTRELGTFVIYTECTR